MDTTRRLRIVQEPSFFRLMELPTVFVAVFGVVWLFIEPLATLGIVPNNLLNLGIWWYIILVSLPDKRFSLD